MDYRKALSVDDKAFLIGNINDAYSIDCEKKYKFYILFQNILY